MSHGVQLGNERVCHLSRSPDAVEGARRFAEQATRRCDEACREAVTMATAELAENLLKYAEGKAAGSSTDPFAGTLGIGFGEAEVFVRSKNTVSEPRDAERVIDLVDRIGLEQGGASRLYRERVQELFTRPELPRTQLGLLRLAFEGGFQLSARFEASVLEIVARRPTGGQP